MKYTIKKSYEWLYPDDICQNDNPFCQIHIEMPQNSSEALQLLVDTPWENLKKVSVILNTGFGQIIPAFFSLIPVKVEKNTGMTGYTANEGETLFHVTRKAPFYVYDALAPFGEFCYGEQFQRTALYIRIDTSIDCVPGEYEQKVEVSFNSERILLSIIISVVDFSIPQKTHLNISNWYNTGNIASRHGIEIWSKDYWNMFEKYTCLMERTHQNCFLLPYSAVECSKRGNSWHFNFDKAERIIEIFSNHGLEILEIGPVIKQLFLGDEHFVLLENDTVLATSEEGIAFLKEYYLSLLYFLDRKWPLKKCFFHVADEPYDVSISEYLLMCDKEVIEV